MLLARTKKEGYGNQSLPKPSGFHTYWRHCKRRHPVNGAKDQHNIVAAAVVLHRMKALKRVVALFVFVLVSSLVTISPAQAEVSCHKINAQGVGQDLGDGTTLANIIGGGLLQGTTEGHFTITGGSFPVFLIAGTVEFTTNNGTLTVNVTGTFDLSTGEFRASGPVIAATGQLSGATGELQFQGVENLSNGSFVEDVTGEICVDLAP
jgi:hypothetical protein